MVDDRVLQIIDRPDIGRVELGTVISDMIKRDAVEIRKLAKSNAEKLSKIQEHREGVKQFQKDEKIMSCLNNLITAYDSAKDQAQIIGGFLGSSRFQFRDLNKRRKSSAGLMNLISPHSRKSSFRLSNGFTSGRPQSSSSRKLNHSLRQYSSDKLSGVQISFSPQVKSTKYNKRRSNSDVLTTLRINPRYA